MKKEEQPLIWKSVLGLQKIEFFYITGFLDGLKWGHTSMEAGTMIKAEMKMFDSLMKSGMFKLG